MSNILIISGPLQLDGCNGPLIQLDGCNGPLIQLDGCNGPLIQLDGCNGPLIQLDGCNPSVLLTFSYVNVKWVIYPAKNII